MQSALVTGYGEKEEEEIQICSIITVLSKHRGEQYLQMSTTKIQSSTQYSGMRGHPGYPAETRQQNDPLLPVEVHLGGSSTDLVSTGAEEKVPSVGL